MNHSPIILVDADILVAMIKRDDSNHLKSERVFNSFENTKVSFIITNYVFSEAVTVISQKINHQTAIGFISNMKSTDSIISVKWITPEIEEDAIEIFKQQTSKNVSFIDCTNMALVKHENLDAIFSFDEIYKKNGYRMANTL